MVSLSVLSLSLCCIGESLSAVGSVCVCSFLSLSPSLSFSASRSLSQLSVPFFFFFFFFSGELTGGCLVSGGDRLVPLLETRVAFILPTGSVFGSDHVAAPVLLSLRLPVSGAVAAGSRGHAASPRAACRAAPCSLRVVPATVLVFRLLLFLFYLFSSSELSDSSSSSAM